MKSPWLTTVEAAELLRFVDREGRPNLTALRAYLTRHKVPAKKRGRAVLIHRDDLEQTLVERAS